MDIIVQTIILILLIQIAIVLMMIDSLEKEVIYHAKTIVQIVLGLKAGALLTVVL
jgi:hypothetical protein